MAKWGCGVSCFGGLELGFWNHVFWNVFGGIFLGHVLGVLSLGSMLVSWGCVFMLVELILIPSRPPGLRLRSLGWQTGGRVMAARLMLAPSHWAISSDLNRRDSVPMGAGGWEIGMVLPSTSEPN